jgi:hypothetical protein
LAELFTGAVEKIKDFANFGSLASFAKANDKGRNSKLKEGRSHQYF